MGVSVDVALLCMLWVLWQLSRWYAAIMRRLGLRERLKITWGGARCAALRCAGLEHLATMWSALGLMASSSRTPYCYRTL
jgi:hypothetical protein